MHWNFLLTATISSSRGISTQAKIAKTFSDDSNKIKNWKLMLAFHGFEV